MTELAQAPATQYDTPGRKYDTICKLQVPERVPSAAWVAIEFVVSVFNYVVRPAAGLSMSSSTYALARMDDRACT